MKVNELPPVPDDPVLPPEVTLRDEERLPIVADDGTKLDGRVVVPSGARRVVVLAHPHPLFCDQAALRARLDAEQANGV